LTLRLKRRQSTGTHEHTHRRGLFRGVRLRPPQTLIIQVPSATARRTFEAELTGTDRLRRNTTVSRFFQSRHHDYAADDRRFRGDMVLTALSPGSFTLLLLTVILVLASALIVSTVKLPLICSPTCSDTDDEAIECEYRSLDGDAKQRRPNSSRRQPADRR